MKWLFQLIVQFQAKEVESERQHERQRERQHERQRDELYDAKENIFPFPILNEL